MPLAATLLDLVPVGDEGGAASGVEPRLGGGRPRSDRRPDRWPPVRLGAPGRRRSCRPERPRAAPEGLRGEGPLHLEERGWPAAAAPDRERASPGRDVRCTREVLVGLVEHGAAIPWTWWCVAGAPLSSRRPLLAPTTPSPSLLRDRGSQRARKPQPRFDICCPPAICQGGRGRAGTRSIREPVERHAWEKHPNVRLTLDSLTRWVSLFRNRRDPQGRPELRKTLDWKAIR